MFRLLLWLLVSVAVGGHLSAEHLFTGMAIDSDGRGMAGLQIELASGLGGLDPVFDDTVLETLTDKDGKFVLETGWGRDLSFHVLAYSDTWFGELSDRNFRPSGESTDVCIVCGVCHTASIKLATGLGADEDRRCMIVLRTGDFSVRFHLHRLPENEVLKFPVGNPTLDLLCLASPIDKDIPKLGEMATRGWMMRGEVRGAKCGTPVTVPLHDFREDGGAKGKSVRLKLPRLGGPFDVIGLDRSGVPIWHETLERFWRVHCGGSEVERIYDLGSKLVNVGINPGERVRQLVFWDRDEGRECLFDVDDLSYEVVTAVEWTSSEQSRFSVQMGHEDALNVRKHRHGIEIRLSNGPYFAIKVVPIDDKGVIHFDMPSSFAEVEIQFPLGSGTSFTEPRRVKIRRGVPSEYAGGELERYHLTIQGPSEQSLQSLVVPIRRAGEAKLREEFRVVLDASSSVVAYLEPGVEYESQIGGRWLPFVTDPKDKDILLVPWE